MGSVLDFEYCVRGLTKAYCIPPVAAQQFCLHVALVSPLCQARAKPMCCGSSSPFGSGWDSGCISLRRPRELRIASMRWACALGEGVGIQSCFAHGAFHAALPQTMAAMADGVRYPTATTVHKLLEVGSGRESNDNVAMDEGDAAPSGWSWR
jgi:hypothetical protein